MNGITRRRFLAASAAALAAPMLDAFATTAPVPDRMGVAISSYDFRWGGKIPSKKYPPWKTAIDVLEHCHELGAGGLQIGARGWPADFAAKVRDRREKLGLFLEGQIGLPRKPEDAARFEAEAVAAKEAGASVLRTACGGRRYEDLHSTDDFARYRDSARAAIALAEPIVRRLQLKLAVENHKDWRVPELVELMQHIGSEYVGVTLDAGNSIALLEDPVRVVEALAPLTFTVHFKDMGVQEYEQGFLLSEVPLGQGILDLPRMVAVCRQSSPAMRFNLEMITRDPLRVPCLTDGYFASMPNIGGVDLARTLSLIKSRAATTLPHVTGLTPDQKLELEERQVKESFAYAREKLGL